MDEFLPSLLLQCFKLLRWLAKNRKLFVERNLVTIVEAATEAASKLTSLLQLVQNLLKLKLEDSTHYSGGLGQTNDDDNNYCHWPKLILNLPPNTLAKCLEDLFNSDYPSNLRLYCPFCEISCCDFKSHINKHVNGQRRFSNSHRTPHGLSENRRITSILKKVSSGKFSDTDLKFIRQIYPDCNFCKHCNKVFVGYLNHRSAKHNEETTYTYRPDQQNDSETSDAIQLNSAQDSILLPGPGVGSKERSSFEKSVNKKGNTTKEVEVDRNLSTEAKYEAVENSILSLGRDNNSLSEGLTIPKQTEHSCRPTYLQTKRTDSDNKVQYSCERCQMLFRQMSELKNHERETHKGHKPFLCCHCRKKFARKIALAQHIAQWHIEEGVVTSRKRITITKSDGSSLVFGSQQWPASEKGKCRICGLNVIQLREHILAAHFQKAQFQCQFCPSVFKLKQNLINHENMHTGFRPYSCKICEKSFTSKSSLSKHKSETHSQVPRFGCPSCGQLFKTSSGMKRHLNMKHRTGVSCLCDICGASFKDSHPLRKHKFRVHCRSQRLQCNSCPKKFLLPETMAKHITTVHPKASSNAYTVLSEGRNDTKKGSTPVKISSDSSNIIRTFEDKNIRLSDPQSSTVSTTLDLNSLLLLPNQRLLEQNFTHSHQQTNQRIIHPEVPYTSSGYVSLSQVFPADSTIQNFASREQHFPLTASRLHVQNIDSSVMDIGQEFTSFQALVETNTNACNTEQTPGTLSLLQ